MKKMICFALAVTLALSLAACQTSNPTDSKADSTGSTTGSVPDKLVAPMDLDQIYASITADVDMPEMIRVEHDMLLDLYGVKPEHFQQAEVYICADSLRADEIWLIEAKDAEALAQLKTLAQNRINQKDEESATYSPEQNAIVKKAKVIERGNYLVMLVSPDVDALAERLANNGIR